MSTYDEQAHPRATDGRFAPKDVAETPGGLSALGLGEPVDEEVLADAKEGWLECASMEITTAAAAITGAKGWSSQGCDDYKDSARALVRDVNAQPPSPVPLFHGVNTWADVQVGDTTEVPLRATSANRDTAEEFAGQDEGYGRTVCEYRGAPASVIDNDHIDEKVISGRFVVAEVRPEHVVLDYVGPLGIQD